MNKVTSYLKNVGKSVSYANVEIAKKLVPEVREFIDTNENLFKAVYATVSAPKKSLKYGTEYIKKSQIYDEVHKGIDNVISDIKTGNFYNKNRQQDSYDSIADEWMGGSDFDDDNFSDLDDWDFDEDDEESSVNKGDILVSDTVSKSSNLSAQLISNTVAATSNNIVNANIATAKMSMSQNIELVAGIRTSIAGVHESINSVLKFSTETIVPHMQNQVQYWNDSINVMKENNAILKEMLEMQRNIYKNEQKKEELKNQFASVFSGSTFDLTAYFKAITKNAKKLDPTGSIDMLFDSDGGSLISTMFANPLGSLLVKTIEGFIDPKFAKSVGNFSKSLENLFPVIISKLNTFKNKDGLLGIIGKVFGLQTPSKDSIDTSKYNKGAVPFDGITRKAIVDVIPEHLSRIESLLSNSTQRTFDYENGKWISTKDIQSQFDKDKEQAVRNSFDPIINDIQNFIKGLEKTKGLSYEHKKSLEEDVYKIMLKTFKDGRFSPENVKANMLDYDIDNEEIINKMMTSLTKNVPLHKLMEVTKLTQENKGKLSEKRLKAESSGISTYTKLFDNSNTNKHLVYDKKYKDIVTGTKEGKSFLNIKDSYGKNTLDYLKELLVNVSYIRQYGLSSTGSIGSLYYDNNKSIDFDDYSKQFNTKYKSKELKKLEEKERYSESSYNKYNFDENVDLDNRLDLGNYYMKKNGDKWSDLDDDVKKMGKFYKETNKWQKAMDNIPGKTFAEKWENAQSSKDKQSLLIGTISTFAKKPMTIVDDMINNAEKSIYNFLFKAETDEFDEKEGTTIKGHFNAILAQIRSAWDRLVGSIDEKLITPIANKLELQDKWEKLKEKFSNSKPGQWIKNAKDNLSSTLKKDIGSGVNYVKNTVKESLDPIMYNKTFKDIHERKIDNKEKLIYNNSEEMVNAIDSIKDPSEKAYAKYQLSGRNKAEITKSRFKIIRKALKDNDLDTLKTHLGELSKYELKYLKSKLAQENPEFLEKIKNAGFSKGGVLKVIKDGLLPPYPVSKGEKIKIIPNEEREQRKNQEEETNNVIKVISNSIGANEKLQAKIVSTKEKLKEHENDNSLISDFIEGTAEELNNIKNSAVNTVNKGIETLTGVEGDTPEKQEKNKLLNTVVDVFKDIKGSGAATASKAILGGGLGLLSGVIGGPLIGAGIGASYSLIKNSDTLKNILFGEEIEEGGERKGGIVSKKIQDAFTKYIPDMGKGSILGAIASFITPFGPLAGAAVGAGIGLAKNSETMREMIFGEDGLINKDRKEKLKKFLPKAAIGATAGMFVGPFGLLGNAAIGAGVGLLTGTEDFKDLIFGEKDGNNNRFGGIKGALDEYFVEPIKNFGQNFKDDFFDFIKESMIDPLNRAITPITAGIANFNKRILIDFPKWLLQLGKDYIAEPLMRKIEDSLIAPLFNKIIKPMFSGIIGKVKGLIAFPFKAIGKAGDQARRHQVKQGRDVVGTAKDRIKFADEQGLGDYKYRDFDKKLKDKTESEDTAWLEELTARTGILAHGSDHFNKEVKKARKELSRVVSDYYKSGLFAKDKKSYKRIRQYIANNDIESAIQELTEITDSRPTGGPLGSDAADAITRFNKANKKYQVARDNRDKFGNINEEDNVAWMTQHFGSNWKELDSKKLFEYARRESSKAGGKKVSKSDLFKDPTQLITKGEEEINNTLNKILKLLKGDKYEFQDKEKDEEYDRNAKSGIEKSKSKINDKIINIKNTLNEKGYNFVEVSPILDDLYEHPLIYELVLVASKQNINYDHQTIKKLCKMKLSKKEIKLLKRFPYVATLPEKDIKKNLNHLRNDQGTLFSNKLFGGKKLRNDNLSFLNFVGELNEKLDESKLQRGKDVDKDDDSKYRYENTNNYGLRRYIKDQRNKWTLDLSDSDTKESIQEEKAEKAKKNSFFNSFGSVKDGILGIFNANKKKEEDDEKEPWYKKLFNFDLSSISGKLKLGAAFLGILTGVGAIANFLSPDGDDNDGSGNNSITNRITTKITETVTPVLSKIGNWIMNEGEYAAPDKGMSGFLDKYVFPNLFTGMDIFFGKVLPAVVTAFVKNIPTIVKGAITGVLKVFGLSKDSNDEDATINISTAKTVNGDYINRSTSTNTSSGSSWVNKLISDSTSTATNIESITADEDGNIISTSSYNSSNSGSSDSTVSYDGSVGSNNSTSSNSSDGSNDQVMFDGVGPIYRKTKNGKLVPITAGELASGNITEFYNENGGHWVYDQQRQSFVIAEDSKTGSNNKLPSVLTYAAAKSVLTGRSPRILKVFKNSKVSSVLKVTDKVLKNTPFIKTPYKLFSTPVKAVGKSFGAFTKTGAYIGRSFNRAFNDSDIIKKAAKEQAEKEAKKAAKKKAVDASIGRAETSYKKYTEKQAKKEAKKAAKKKTSDVIKDGANKVKQTANKNGYSVRAGNKSKKTSDVIKDGANKASKVDKSHKAGLLKRVTKFCKSKLENIFNNSKVYKKITEAIAESGVKKKPKAIIKSIIDKIMDIIAKRILKSSSNIVVKMASLIGSGGTLTAVFAIGDFVSGIDKAESILGISDPTILQTLIAGLANIIANELFFGLIPTSTWVNLLVDAVFPFFNIDLTEFKEKRAKEEEITKEENLKNGDNVTTEERLERDYSITGKVKSKIKGVKNTVGGAIKKGITGIGKFINEETDGKFVDYASYAKNVAKDIFADAIAGKNVKTEGVVIDKDDPNYDTKKTIYYITKLALYLPASIVRLGKGLVDTLSGIGNGLINIGTGIGKNTATMFKKAWNGDILEAFSAPKADTGHPVSNAISNVLTEALIKPFMAAPTLLTAGVGAIVRNIDPIIDRFKTIGSSVTSSVTDRFKNAWAGNIEGILENNNPNTGNKLIDGTAGLINGITRFGTVVPAFITAGVGAIVRNLNIIDKVKEIQESTEDEKILEDAKNGNIKIWDSAYWKLNKSTDGFTGVLYAFNAYLQKILNLPSALLGAISNIDVGEGIKKVGKKILNWLGIKDEFDEDYDDYDESGYGTGRGTKRRKITGKGALNDNTDFVSQVDPRYKNKRFNTSKDTEAQTIGDSGCAPATAANVINYYAGTGNEFNNATKAALPYKDKNSGVTPEYFQEYLGGKGINTKSTLNKREMINSISSGNPTILLGRNINGRGRTPYGPRSSHYVLATGLDGRGNVIIQNPESRKPNELYPMKDVINNSQLGVITGQGSTLESKFSEGVFGYYDEKLMSLLGLDQTAEEESIDLSNSSTGVINASGSAADVIRTAQKEVGYEGDGREHQKYGKEYGMNGVYWCCIFVWWVFKHAGASKAFCNGKKVASCNGVLQWYKKHASGNIVGAKNGKPGDLILFSFGRKSGSDHIGIIEQVKGPGQYVTIEGNTSGDKVARKERSSGILTCIRPMYADASSLAGTGTDFMNAATAALQYKDKNSGVTPDYFQDYLGREGINTYSTMDKNELLSNIGSGRPTVLLGQDNTGNNNTPYGPASSHYVLATGLDGNGNVILQDPESRNPNTTYPVKDVINNSQIGIVTSKSNIPLIKYSSPKSYSTNISKTTKKSNFKHLNGKGKSQKEIEAYVWARLRSAGYSEIQTAAIMGNIKHESGFKPSAIEKGGGGGFGLIQWTAGRKTQIEGYARKIGKSASNLEVQVDFLLAELNPKGGAKGYAKFQFSSSSTKYDGKKYTYDTFKNTKDITIATKCFCFCFERPAYSSSVNHIDRRIKSAKEYYKTYTGTEIDTSSIDLSSSDSDESTTETTTTDNIFDRITAGVLGYFNPKLLSLLGLSDDSSTDLSTDSSSLDSSSNSDSGTPNNGYTGGKFTWPLPGHTRITSEYKWRNCPYHGREFHSGIDISAPKGSKIVAAADGKIATRSSTGSYGNHLIIDHGNNLYTLYGHCSKLESSMKVGTYVSKGTKIAEVGSTGSSTGNHLHFEVRKGANKYDNHVSPWNYLSKPSSSGKGSGNITKLSGKGTKKSKSSTTSNNIAAIKSSNTSIKKNGIYVDEATGEILRKKGNVYVDPNTGKKVLTEKNGVITAINKTSTSKALSGENNIAGMGSSLHKGKFKSVSNTFNYSSIMNGRGTRKASQLPNLTSSYNITRNYQNNDEYISTINGRGASITTSSNVDRLLNTIIEVLSIIANNSEKLSQIVSLLSKALDLNLTDNDISKLSSNNAQVKNKIANALKSQGSGTGLGNSVMNSSTESLATAMYSIARA